MDRYKSWIDRATSSYELSKAIVSEVVFYEESIKIAKMCLDWVAQKVNKK